MRSIVCGLVVITASLGRAVASDPGQPYDCADWEILAPGVTCSQAGGWNEAKVFGSDVIVDNGGRLLRMTLKPRPSFLCGSVQANWIVLEAFEGGTSTELLRLGDRCVSSGFMDKPALPLDQGTMAFDPHAGRLYLFVAAKLNFGSFGDRNSPGWPQMTIFAFDGFATTFELLQTYQPPQSLSITVPARPEGLAGADHFDTYWGTLGAPIDLSAAHPLHCDYPAGPPTAGERLEFADTLAVPPPCTE